MGGVTDRNAQFRSGQVRPSEISDQGKRKPEGETSDELRKSRHRKLNYADLGPVDFREAGTTVGDAIRQASDRRVFILGKPPTNAAVLGQAAELDGARIYLDGHYPTVTWSDADGVQRRVSYAQSWFGEGDYTVEDCHAVWRDLQAMIRSVWKDDTAALLMSPATTGRDLWQRTIPADGWPIMSPEWQDEVRSHSGQGRIQTFAGPRLTAGPIHEYDARLAYTALTRRLPVGHPVDGMPGRFDPGKLYVRWTAPAGWKHPGILPEPLPATRSWHWPLTGAGWVDSCEYDLANKWGWSLTVEEAYHWPETADPLRTWQTRLLRILDMADGAGPRTDAWRHACRGMILYALGAMHGAPHKVTASGPNPPRDARSIRQTGPDSYTWHTVQPPAWPDMLHPEWTSTVWARARVRLLDAPRPGGGRCGALHVPAETLIAFRTDAIYTDAPMDVGDDDGAPGRYRLKATYPQGPRPRSGLDILRLKAGR